MNSLYAWLLMSTVAIQVPNLIGMQINRGPEGLDLISALKISMLTLPLTFVATAGFTLFYGRGSELYSYPTLSVFAKVAALVVALGIQVWVIKSRSTNMIEIVGISLCLIGFIIAVYNKEIMKLF